MWLNYTRKSTAGWSIINILLDFTGGSLSILQQVIDMIHNGLTEGDWRFFGSGGDAFNIVKFMLGVTAVFFDIIFMVQHFILYRHPEQSAIEDELTIDKPVRHSLLVEEDDDDIAGTGCSPKGEERPLNYTHSESS
jgi:cystinosin